MKNEKCRRRQAEAVILHSSFCIFHSEGFLIESANAPGVWQAPTRGRSNVDYDRQRRMISPLAGYCVGLVGFLPVSLVITGLLFTGWLLSFSLLEPRHHQPGSPVGAGDESL